MIEKFIKNELSLKRWRSFKRRKLAVISCIIFLVMLVSTFISPFLANSKPIMMRYKGNYYFPVVKDYHPRHFGITDILSVDYRKIELSSEDFSICHLLNGTQMKVMKVLIITLRLHQILTLWGQMIEAEMF